MINEQKLLILPFLEVAEMRLHSQSQWSICYLNLYMSCACSWTKYAQHNIIAKYFQALWDVKTFWGIGVGGVGPLFSKFKNRMQKVKIITMIYWFFGPSVMECLTPPFMAMSVTWFGLGCHGKSKFNFALSIYTFFIYKKIVHSFIWETLKI